MLSESQCATLIHYFPHPMTDRIRTTISLDPEVHAIFVRMAEAAGQSVSRCMGDWLADTAEGAQLVALKMQEARNAPKTVMRELQAMARGLVDEVDTTLDAIRKKSLGGAGQAKAQPRMAGSARALPPSSNTGGKVPRKTLGSRGGKGV